MDLKKWKIFEKLDPFFTADIKRAYLVGIDSRQEENKEEGESEELTWRGSVIVMRNGDVYCIALASNEVPLLGPEHSEELRALVPVKIEALCGLETHDIASECDRVTALTKYGRILQWGLTWGSQNQPETLGPQFLTGNLAGKKVVQVACGQSHVMALTQEGEVYSWGQNLYGQLGSGTVSDEPGPVKISGLNGFNKKIVTIACGGWNSYALDSDGDVWSWGSHAMGALA